MSWSFPPLVFLDARYSRWHALYPNKSPTATSKSNATFNSDAAAPRIPPTANRSYVFVAAQRAAAASGRGWTCGRAPAGAQGPFGLVLGSAPGKTPRKEDAGRGLLRPPRARQDRMQ